MFEFATPQSVLDDMEETDDGTPSLGHVSVDMIGKAGARPLLKRVKTRKDSFGAVAGLTEHLSDFLHEHGGGDIPSRLESLEEATKRIEVLLAKISQNLGGDSSDSDTPLPRVGRHDADEEG